MAKYTQLRQRTQLHSRWPRWVHETSHSLCVCLCVHEHGEIKSEIQATPNVIISNIRWNVEDGDDGGDGDEEEENDGSGGYTNIAARQNSIDDRSFALFVVLTTPIIEFIPSMCDVIILLSSIVIGVIIPNYFIILGAVFSLSLSRLLFILSTFRAIIGRCLRDERVYITEIRKCWKLFICGG